MATPAGNYQFAFGDYSFGGTQYGVQILEIDGLESIPSLRVQDDSGGYRDGQFTGRDFLNGRYITMQLQVMNDGVNTMQTYLAQLKNAFLYQQTGTTLMQFQLPGRAVQQMYGRVRKRDIKIDPEYVYGRAVATVEIFCPDPRLYDATSQSLVLTASSGYGRVYTGIATVTGAEPVATLTSLASSGSSTLAVDDRTGFLAYQFVTITDGISTEVVQISGSYTQATGAGNLILVSPLTYSHAISTVVSVQGRIYNLIYGTSISGSNNSGSVSNGGTTTTYPSLTITGPCTNPIIRNQSTGAQIALSVTLAGNDVIVIDPDLRSITLNGNPARNLLVNGSTWWGLPSGSTTIGFVATTYGSGCSLTVSWRNAYV